MAELKQAVCWGELRRSIELAAENGIPALIVFSGNRGMRCSRRRPPRLEPDRKWPQTVEMMEK